MKKLVPAYILAFVASFMLFLYEPITMYANNINDFWFDLYIMIKPTLIIFFSVFFTISIIYTIIYFLNKKFSEKLCVYNIVLILSFIVFLALYIQGNFLAGNLPALDGTKINWSEYKLDGIISIGLWLIILIILSIAIVKLKFEKVIKYATYVSCAVFVMLFMSFITIILSTDVFVSKETMRLFSDDNINMVSSNKNMFIILVDAVDSKTFEKAMNNQEYKETFYDFTYYPDTMGGYAFTRDSIPLVLSGEWNENNKSFAEYSSDALNKAELFKELQQNDYDINIYDDELIWNDDKSVKISNAININSVNTKNYLKQELKYILYRYLPFPLKKYSRIEKMNFKESIKLTEQRPFKWDNIIEYNRIKEQNYQVCQKNYFQFLHLEGSHVPFNLDSNLNYIENGTYDQKVEATLKLLNDYIEKLKKSNVYDNSAIVIIADHGYNYENVHNTDGRQNPILFIKGRNEKHNMIKSEIPISFDDLTKAYIELINDTKSTELFKNIDTNRERRFLRYDYKCENHIVEYMQKGKAWDMNTMYETGRVFDR